MSDYRLIAADVHHNCYYVDRSSRCSHCVYKQRRHSQEDGQLERTELTIGGRRWRCPSKAVLQKLGLGQHIVAIPKKWHNLPFAQRASWSSADGLYKHFLVSDQKIIIDTER